MKFEDLDKKWERWHNRIFPTVSHVMILSTVVLCASSSVLMSLYIQDLATAWNSDPDQGWLTFELYLIIFYISIIISPFYFIYTRFFTKFHFPARESGGGRKPKKPLSPYGR